MEIIEIYAHCWDKGNCHHCALIKTEDGEIGKELLWGNEIYNWLIKNNKKIPEHFRVNKNDKCKKDYKWSYQSMVKTFWNIQGKLGDDKLYPNLFFS
jgi:hypothetical protein